MFYCDFVIYSNTTHICSPLFNVFIYIYIYIYIYIFLFSSELSSAKKGRIVTFKLVSDRTFLKSLIVVHFYCLMKPHSSQLAVTQTKEYCLDTIFSSEIVDSTIIN